MLVKCEFVIYTFLFHNDVCFSAGKSVRKIFNITGLLVIIINIFLMIKESKKNRYLFFIFLNYNFSFLKIDIYREFIIIINLTNAIEIALL